MHNIDSLPLLELGNQNESGATSVVIDVSAWDDYTLQVAANPGVSDGLWITYMRPGETAVYPVDAADLAVSTIDDAEVLTWKVSNAVTEKAGLGTVIVNLTDTGVEKKSSKTHMMIKEGHAAAGDPPEPLADYIEKWGAVDLTVTGLDEDEEPTGAVTQDETGTHIALGIPTGVTAYASAVTGGYNGTLEDFYADFAILNELYASLLEDLEAI